MPPTTTTTLSNVDFNAPIQNRCFEDYVPGSVYVYGSITMTEQDILRFAGEFDPQNIHNADHFVSKVASPASPGVDELRWVRPVRPGDSLSIRTTIQEARVSRSKPDRGIVHTAVEVLNQRSEPVLTMTAMNILLRRVGVTALL
ncbi:acyl dehydratase [Streptomyces sp. NPDC050508]|uniref:acyl dehydratase n=1 Tax=Streptomyces sp. NPDC050508 TaxID=3155405 RepID=UPI00343136B2